VCVCVFYIVQCVSMMRVQWVQVGQSHAIDDPQALIPYLVNTCMAEGEQALVMNSCLMERQFMVLQHQRL